MEALFKTINNEMKIGNEHATIGYLKKKNRHTGQEHKAIR